MGGKPSPAGTVALVAISLLAGCLDAGTTTCSDGRVCATGRVCDQVHGTCVFPDQLHSCVGKDDRADCTVPGNVDGVCRDQVCVRKGCGDGFAEDPEQCDDADLRGADDCTDIGFHQSGAIGCNDDCTYDHSQCQSYCGDGVIDTPVEDCEPGVAGAATDCLELGFYDSAPLGCNSLCRYDITGCTGYCGDGEVGGPEVCDGSNFAGADCRDAGFYFAPGLLCTGFCQFDTGNCKGRCGDNEINDASEQCDGAPPPVGTCLDYGFDAGGLGCSTLCLPGFDDCARIGWTLMPRVTAATLTGVWGSGPDDVYAVGGGIIHFDGIGWGTPVGGASPIDLWGSGPDDIHAVGMYGSIQHWDGTQWTDETSPTTDSLNAVWGSGAGDVFAVGDEGTIVHYDGSAWSVQSSPTSGNLVAVWGSASDDVYAAGYSGDLLHYNGSAWSAQTAPTALSIFAIAGSAADDVYLAADGVYHWNGGGWTRVLNPGLVLYGLYVESRSDVVVVGQGGYTARFDGQRWVQQRSAPADLDAVWGSGAGDLFAVGTVGTVVHGQGSAWAVADSAIVQASAAWGRAADDLFVVDYDGNYQLRHFDGSTWSSESPPTGSTVQLEAMWGSPTSGDVFAVGLGGAIDHYDGSTWSQESAGITDSLFAVWGTGASDVFAVGAEGVIVHRDASGWSVQQPAAAAAWLFGVWGSASDDVWAVGLNGRVRHYDGSTWQTIAVPTSPDLYGVWGSGADDVFAVGTGGAILHYDGTGWTEMESPTYDRLTAVWGSAGDDVFASGGSGEALLFHYGGGRWTPVRLPGDFAPFRALWGDGRDIYLFGSGAIHLDRAVPWDCRPSETVCDDRVDDDCDGKIDGDDSDC